MVDCIIPHGTLEKGVLNDIYRLKIGRVPVWLDANLDIATKKTISSTVEAIHASTESLGTIE
jgi:hypothetical protein